MTSYKVLELPFDVLIGENLTYTEAQNLRNEQSANFPEKSFVIDKMPLLRDKLQIALDELALWHIDAKNHLPTMVYSMMASAGYKWSKRYDVWYHDSDKHELFKLHWLLSIKGQETIISADSNRAYRTISEVDMIDIGRTSAMWLDERGFNSAAIFKDWQNSQEDSNREDNEPHCEICVLSQFNGLNENNLCPLCAANNDDIENDPRYIAIGKFVEYVDILIGTSDFENIPTNEITEAVNELNTIQNSVDRKIRADEFYDEWFEYDE